MSEMEKFEKNNGYIEEETSCEISNIEALVVFYVQWKLKHIQTLAEQTKENLFVIQQQQKQLDDENSSS